MEAKDVRKATLMKAACADTSRCEKEEDRGEGRQKILSNPPRVAHSIDSLKVAPPGRGRFPWHFDFLLPVALLERTIWLR
jgi:hypothetical protein